MTGARPLRYPLQLSKFAPEDERSPVRAANRGGRREMELEESRITTMDHGKAELACAQGGT